MSISRMVFQTSELVWTARGGRYLILYLRLGFKLIVKFLMPMELTVFPMEPWVTRGLVMPMEGVLKVRWAQT